VIDDAPAVLLDLVKIGTLVFLLAVLQVSAATQLSPNGGAPDLVLVAVVALALWRGLETAALAGFFGGLLIDGVTFAPLGVTSLLYLGAALLVAWRAHRGRPGHRLTPDPRRRRLVAWAIFAAVVVQIADVLLHVLLGTELPVGYLLRAQIAPSVIQTGLAALILSPLLRRMFAHSARTDVSVIAAA
jgi:rod shape-determining protein MreD